MELVENHKQTITDGEYLNISNWLMKQHNENPKPHPTPPSRKLVIATNNSAEYLAMVRRYGATDVMSMEGYIREYIMSIYQAFHIRVVSHMMRIPITTAENHQKPIIRMLKRMESGFRDRFPIVKQPVASIMKLIDYINAHE